ncbi:MAG TPA: DNA adenine methylase, partial [Dehalococcoidia bacterium]|nr:DNA adenine methylase [Dehalococcoidia bacterium]
MAAVALERRGIDTAGVTARPFLKWAGGKSQLLPELVRRSPRRIETYYEPFLGGAALFFALSSDPERAPRRAVLNDLNGQLMTTYGVVRDEPEALVAALERLQEQYACADDAGRAALYYRIRDEHRRAVGVEIAARVIFLNKTCFNGLFRVNRRGEFNVPFGRYKSPRILDREGLLAASQALRGVELRSADFEGACADAGSGDFVYFDPPFHPLSATSNFTAYTERDFGRAEQIRLKRCIDGLTSRGVAVMLSNSPHPWIRGGYEFAGYDIDEVQARRAINSRGDGRGPIGEILVSNQPLILALENEVEPEPVL